MINRDDLKTAVALVGVADVAIGSNVPQNMRRFIYKIKATNMLAGPNLLTLGKRENGAGATTPIDYIPAAVQYDIWNDPDELKEDSEPLYIIEGAGTGGASTVRGIATGASFYVFYSYIDAPA